MHPDATPAICHTRSPFSYPAGPFTRMNGFSLPAALFILVILSMLAAVIYRTVAVGNSAVALEMLSARAFLAAESGAQAAMMRVFPTTGAGSCSNATWTLTGSGLNNCTVSTTCNTQTADGETLYPITSSAVCTAGNLQASRSLEVLAH